jgi:hypothetical protein
MLYRHMKAGDSVSTSTTASKLATTGLSEDQREHFEKHGWVLLEGAIDAHLCQACIAAIAELPARLRGFEPDSFGARGYGEPHMFHSVFLDTYKIPGLLEAVGQLVGHPAPRLMDSLATIATPFAGGDGALLEPSRWAWHRDIPPVTMPPSTGATATPHPAVTVAMYFVPVSPEHGVTAFLDGSHTVERHWFDEGEIYGDIGDQFEVVQPSAPAGSIVIFSAGLVHAGRPVRSDQTRYATFNWLAAPWLDNGRRVNPYLIERYADDKLRSLFRSPPEHDWSALLVVED